MSHQQKMAKKETEGAGGAELKCWQGHRSTWAVPRHRAPGKALLLHSPGLPRRAVGWTITAPRTAARAEGFCTSPACEGCEDRSFSGHRLPGSRLVAPHPTT